MNYTDMLNDYEQFTSYFMALDTSMAYPQPVDIDSILESLETEESE